MTTIECTGSCIDNRHHYPCAKWGDCPAPSGPGLKSHRAFLTQPRPMDRWLREASVYTWPMEWQVARGFRKRVVKDEAWYRQHESGAAARKRHKAWLRNVRPTLSSTVKDDTPGVPAIVAARAIEAKYQLAEDDAQRAALLADWKRIHADYWGLGKAPRRRARAS